MKTEEVLTETRQNSFTDNSKERRSAPSDFTIGGPLSAFSGIISLTPPADSLKHRLIHHRPSISPVGPPLSGHLYPRAALYNHQFSESSPDIPIAPAFAQIFQRRRRRENRPRRQRTTFTSEQTLKLELEYNRADYITRPRRFELAEILSLSESQIKIWFQNRRAKDKRIEKAHMDHQLRTMGYNSVQGLLPVPFPCSGMCGTCVVPPASLPVPSVSAMCSSTSKTLKLL